MVTRERRDSEDDLDDIIQQDSMQDKLKLQSLLSEYFTDGQCSLLSVCFDCEAIKVSIHDVF
jgi:hypothetical protein